MNTLRTLLRKHFIESRLMLCLSASAFFGLAVLMTWLASRFERLIASGELDLERRARGVGVLRVLGGPEMDFSTTAMEVCWWNHPVIVLTVLSWAVSRGAASVAGEVERGTVDVTLSRPVSRPAYLWSQVIFATLGLVALATALVVGTLVGGMIYPLKAPPGLGTLLRPAAMIVTLGMAVYGYTLPFSSVDVVRWRPSLAAGAVTLGGLISMSVASQFDDYEKLLERLSVFRAYAPVTVALKGEPLGYNCTVLLLVFGAGLIVSFLAFVRRDIPSNS
jgi:ABC-2 type transport system permease protein